MIVASWYLVIGLVLPLLLTKISGEEDVLLNFVNTDTSWRWVTMYRLGPGSGWERDSSSGSYMTCDLISTKTNSTDSWLISDYIPVKHAKTVTLAITFTARKCNLANFPYCKQSIGIYSNKNDVSKVGGVTMDTILAGNFTFVGNGTADHVWSSGVAAQDNVVNITFSVLSQGIYVGFRDTGACVAIKAVLMTSQFCPRTVSGGAVFNKTGVALPGYDNKVKGECLEMSENLANGSELYLRCLGNGSWSSSLRVTCQCKAGYQPGQRTCQGCPSGLYKPSTGNTMCTPCPENTHSNAARNECTCNHGFYRRDVYHGKCTAPPSAPRDLSSTVIGQRVILLSWKRPLNDGGRNDLLYSISCFLCNHSNIQSNSSCRLPCGSNIKYNPSANRLAFTHVISSGLVPGSLYSFMVVSQNGVSGLVGNSSRSFAEIRSVVPVPVAPKMLVSFTGNNMVVLSLSGVTNDKPLSSFVYSLSCRLCDKIGQDCVTCTKPCGNAIEYHPSQGFIDQTFTVVNGLMDASRYQFTLSVTERDNSIQNSTSTACVTTKKKDTKDTGNSNESASTKQQDTMTLYSKVAFGLSAGFFLCSIIVLLVSLCLRKKWYKKALSLEQNSTESQSRPSLTTVFNNDFVGQENVLYMEERAINNNQ